MKAIATLVSIKHPTYEVYIDELPGSKPEYAKVYETKATTAINRYRKTGERTHFMTFEHHRWCITVMDECVLMDNIHQTSVYITY